MQVLTWLFAEDEDDARPAAAKPAGEGGSKSAEAEPAEASSSSSSSSSSSESESGSTSSDGEGGGGRVDPRGEEDVDVVGLSPASPEPAEGTVAVIHPFKPRGGVTVAAIRGFREACASAEEGDLVAQLSHQDPADLFVSSNEVLLRALALNAAASTAADRRLERLAAEKEALRREVSEEAEGRKRAEASAAEAKEAREALASETARLRAELQASKDAEARQAKEIEELHQRARDLESFVVANLGEATQSLTEVLEKIGTECQAPEFGDQDPIGDRADYLKTAASIADEALTGFALMAGRVAGQGVLHMLHAAGCDHLRAATSVAPVAFGGPHLVTPPGEVRGAWRRLQDPWKEQGCEAVLDLMKALRQRRFRGPTDPDKPSTSTPPPPKV
ncbi:hypothetical protein GUJ93_ZPchr0001g29505 [Zizania palustris]|uniref:Uncharacterized protein n=1 Tax=Zizania palustris TaxID=103762 RepID=A0A8J5VLY6_ZIZPA|nr:hypothetical protein GUJ93_ZPchr0001g29505 [Zizania palustris]